MTDILFVAGFGSIVALMLLWGFKTLPKEKWQMIGALPVKKNPDGRWQAVNLTYYGFFTAVADTLAVALFLVLMGALHIPLKVCLMIAGFLVALCLPFARLIARVVEKKRYTASIAGALFVGLLVFPWLIRVLQEPFRSRFQLDLTVMSIMAAATAAYAFGEAVGRLACISFGCCYGKRLDEVQPLFRKLAGLMSVIPVLNGLLMLKTIFGALKVGIEQMKLFVFADPGLYSVADIADKLFQRAGVL